MDRTIGLAVGVEALAILGATLLLWNLDLFLPEAVLELDEPAREGTLIAAGEFQGKAQHAASGRVELLRVGNEHYLRFEDFMMTSGPDVYVYLTPSADPDTSEEINAGLKIYIDGGAEDGEITKRGTFYQVLPRDLGLEDYQGVGAWCDAFNVPFASAPLVRV